MIRNRSMSCSLALIALISMAVPQAAIAATQAKHTTLKVLDVTLHNSDIFVGQLVGAQGKGKQAAEVVVLRKGMEVARTKTDNQGRFAIKGLKGGLYQIATANTRTQVRVWSPATAPPKSAKAALIVEGTTVRGQFGGAGAAGGAGAGAGAASAAVAGGVVAASVAIPTMVSGVVDVGMIDDLDPPPAS